MQKTPDEEDLIDFSHHVVAVIDVSGQRTYLEKMTSIPESPEEKALFTRNAQKTVGVVLKVRKKFREEYLKAFQGPSELDDRVAKVGEDARGTWARLTDCKLRMQQFSDTVLLYSPLRTSYDDLTMRGVYAILVAAGSVMVTGLGSGEFVLRGGIEVGLCTELEENDIYGYPVLRAYELEHLVAGYPRIVIGQGVLRYLDAWEVTSETDAQSEHNRELAEVCRHLMCHDQDGAVIVDFLGEGMYELAKRDTDQLDVIRQAATKGREFVVREHKRFADEGNHKLALKYALLRHYYDSRIGLWEA